jgi:hypothetical protein
MIKTLYFWGGDNNKIVYIIDTIPATDAINKLSKFSVLVSDGERTI